MKLTAILLLSASLSASAIGHSQKVSLNMKNAPVQKVFKELVKQTGVSIICNASMLQGAKPVTINVSNATVEEVIAKCLEGLPLTYTVEGGSIIIQKKEEPKLDGHSGVDPESFSQGPPPPVDISGRVTNNAGEPLSGASVTIRRTGKGTITNANGEFSLKSVNNDDILVVSYIGYATLNIKVGERTSFVLLMNTATDKLDEVKVQAYGTTTDRLRTGNITTITSQEIEQHPVMNVLQALQGKVPGLEITASNGYASSPYKIEIRGRKYMSNNVAPDPLIIIDGVPLTVLDFNRAGPDGSKGFDQNGVPNPVGGRSPLFSIDPNEIESVTVLKDADATAIYGSRGGSGVIIINTKKAKAGKTTFNVSYSSGINKNLRYYNLLNTQDYIAMRKEALKNDNLPIDASTAVDLTKWDTTRYTDWQRFIYGGTGRVSEMQASVTGGSTFTKFRMSLGYDTRKSITATSGSNDRISFSSDVSHASTNNIFKFELTNYYSSTKISEIDWPASAILLPPNAPAVFNSLGRLNYQEWELSGTGSLLDMFQGLLKKYNGGTNFLNSRLAISISPVKGLTFRNNIGYSMWLNDDKLAIPISSQNPRFNPTGYLTNGITTGKTLILEPQIEYKYVGKIINTEILLGSTVQSTSQKSVLTAGSGYQDDNLLGSISNAPIKYGTDNFGEYKYAAIFSRLNFNILSRYIININGRRDGSSRFGPGKQFGNFWSMGGAWIMSDEKWFKSLTKIISFAKIRGSYGTVGSDNINNYVYLTRWSSNRDVVNSYGGTASYAPTQHANPELQWQENKKIEIASNINFLNDRFSFEAAWYRDRCSNQLLFVPLPVMTGFVDVSANLPATVQNSGLEVKVNAAIIKSESLNLSWSFNVGRNYNKLIKFPGIENTSYANQYVVGKALNTSYVVRFTGVDPTTGEYTFEDINKDGVIDIGGIKSKDTYGLDVTARYFGGTGVDLSVGNISFNTYFTFAKLPYVPKAIITGVPGQFGTYNQSTRVLNRWQKPGGNAEFAKFKTIGLPSDQYYRSSDDIFSNGSHLRCQNISLNYSLSKALSKRIKCQSANLFAKAENIFVITNYDGLDPASPGLGSHPPLFTMTVGVSLSF